MILYMIFSTALIRPHRIIVLGSLQEVCWVDIGSGDDCLNHRLAIGTLARARRLERLDGLVERVAVRDERLEVDAALRDEVDGELVVPRLITEMRRD